MNGECRLRNAARATGRFACSGNHREVLWCPRSNSHAHHRGVTWTYGYAANIPIVRTDTACRWYVPLVSHGRGHRYGGGPERRWQLEMRYVRADVEHTTSRDSGGIRAIRRHALAGRTAMFIVLSIATLCAVVVARVRGLFRDRQGQRRQFGSMSERWLAEHRASEQA